MQKAGIAMRTQRALAARLNVHEDMVSHWKRGRVKPTAGQIAALAECANLPILETVAEVEAELDERNSEIWKRALRALQATAATACMTGVVILGTPGQAQAAVNETLLCSSMHICSRAGIWLLRTINTWMRSISFSKLLSPLTT